MLSSLFWNDLKCNMVSSSVKRKVLCWQVPVFSVSVYLLIEYRWSRIDEKNWTEKKILTYKINNQVDSKINNNENECCNKMSNWY